LIPNIIPSPTHARPPPAGIGLKLNSKLSVVEVVPGGAADATGQFSVGDAVTHIDSKLVSGQKLADITHLLIGSEGSKVDITVLKGSGESTTIKLVRKPTPIQQPGTAAAVAQPPPKSEGPSKPITAKPDAPKPQSKPGIGILIQRSATGELSITEVAPGGIAARSGVRVGDVLTHIDARSVVGYTVRDAVPLIAGDGRGSVRLLLLRGESKSQVEVTLHRGGVEEAVNETAQRHDEALAARRDAEQRARKEAEENAQREIESAQSRHEETLRLRKEAEEHAIREQIRAQQEAEDAARAHEEALQLRMAAEEKARKEALEIASRSAAEEARRSETMAQQVSAQGITLEHETQFTAPLEHQRPQAKAYAAPVDDSLQDAGAVRQHAEEAASIEANEAARKHAEQQRLKEEAEDKAEQEAEERALREAQEAARKHAEQQRLLEEAEDKAEREAEQRALLEAQEAARKHAEAQRLQEEAEERSAKEAEERALREADEAARQHAEAQRLKEEAEERAAKEAEAKAKAEAEEAARKHAEAQRLKEEAEDKADKEAEDQALRDAQIAARKHAEVQRLEEEADDKAKSNEAPGQVDGAGLADVDDPKLTPEEARQIKRAEVASRVAAAKAAAGHQQQGPGSPPEPGATAM